MIRDRAVYQRQYRRFYGEKMVEQIRDWFQSHPDYRRGYARRWRRRNPGYHRRWRRENEDRYRRYQKQWRDRNAERLRQYMRLYMRKYRERNGRSAFLTGSDQGLVTGPRSAGSRPGVRGRLG